MGVPYGLAQMVAEEDGQIGLRIYVLDNSGSTCTCDGKYLDPEASGGRMRMVSCTRLEEIKRMALQQAAMNSRLGTPCKFLLLNPPSRSCFSDFREGLNIATVDAAPGSPQAAEQLAALEAMLRRTRAKGTTPLGQRLREVHHLVRQTFAQQARQGLRCVVVVATNGMPTVAGSDVPSEEAKLEVVEELRRLTVDWNAFTVVRLSTDDDETVAFYNKIDDDVELNLEVLDDLEGEAKELRGAGNGWITYSPEIHMIREGGTFVKLLDLMDERRFLPLEVQRFAGRLLQRAECEPLHAGDDADFFRRACEQLQALPHVYDPLRRSMAPPVNEGELRKALGVSLARLVLGQCVRWCQERSAREPLVRG